MAEPEWMVIRPAGGAGYPSVDYLHSFGWNRPEEPCMDVWVGEASQAMRFDKKRQAEVVANLLEEQGGLAIGVERLVNAEWRNSLRPMHVFSADRYDDSRDQAQGKAEDEWFHDLVSAPLRAEIREVLTYYLNSAAVDVLGGTLKAPTGMEARLISHNGGNNRIIEAFRVVQPAGLEKPITAVTLFIIVAYKETMSAHMVVEQIPRH